MGPSAAVPRTSAVLFLLVLAVPDRRVEALNISEVRGTACNHPFVNAHAGPRTARVAAVVILGPVPTASAARWCFGRSGGRIQLLESAPAVQPCVFVLRG